jgi:NTE family protein
MQFFKILGVAFLFLLSSCGQHIKPDPYPAQMPVAPKLNNINVALVLGGGGARGVAHGGVIDVLEENHIPIDLIVGSSAGSVIGALYADDPRADQLRSKVITLKKWDILDVNWSAGLKMLWHINGPVQGDALKKFIKQNIHAKDFSQLKIPLIAVTTDINTGETFIIRSGPLAPALHASSALPMLFAPVKLYGRLLVDGGVASPVPVEVAKQFSPKITIAVDIGTTPNNGDVGSVFQLGYRSLHISYYQLSYWQTQQADVIIHPDIHKFSMFADGNNAQMYRAGREAAIKALPQIQALLGKTR